MLREEPSLFEGVSVDAAGELDSFALRRNIVSGEIARYLAGLDRLLAIEVGLVRELLGERKAGIIKDKDPVPTGEDLREGLIAIISVKLPNPAFNNQPKEKLLNPEIEEFVSNAVGEALRNWLEEHPGDAKRLCMKGIVAAQAREALGHIAPDGPLAQRTQRHLDRLAPRDQLMLGRFQGMPGHDEIDGAIGAQHDQPRRLASPGNHGEHVHGRGIDPVQVFEEQHHRLDEREGLQALGELA